MHLAINGSDLGRKRGGNESFILGLLQGIRQASLPIKTTVVTDKHGVSALKASGYNGQIVDFGRYRRLPFYLYQQLQILKELKPDWYLSTYFLPAGLPCPAAVIVHDVSFRAHPNYFPPFVAWYMRVLTGQAIKKARIVALDSAYTASEVRKYYPNLGDKGIVTYPGVEERFSKSSSEDEYKETLKHYHLSPGYILAIGNIHPRKNLDRLLEAYLLLKDSGQPAPDMVWIGLPRWQSSSLVQRAQEAGIHLAGYVPAERLPALYRAAAVFVYPSLYEGFGLPVLEAMTVGTPVVCSNTTSLPEVADGAALTVEPKDTQALYAAISRVLNDQELCTSLRERGFAQAAKFTYRSTATTLWQALQPS